MAGFEALLRGKSVTTHGLPFYAGWGLSTDLTRCPRRNRVRTIDELTEIAFTRYTRHMDPYTGRACSVHELIDAAGIPSSRFAIEGLADTKPIVPNDSVENRSKNRRVEIKLIQGDDLEAADQLIGQPATAPSLQAPTKIPAPAKPMPAPAKGDPFVKGAG